MVAEIWASVMLSFVDQLVALNVYERCKKCSVVKNLTLLLRLLPRGQ